MMIQRAELVSIVNEAIDKNKRFLKLESDVSGFKADVSELKANVETIIHILTRHEKIFTEYSAKIDNLELKLGAKMDLLLAKFDAAIDGQLAVLDEHRRNRHLIESIDDIKNQGDVTQSGLIEHIADRKAHLPLR